MNAFAIRIDTDPETETDTNNLHQDLTQQQQQAHVVVFSHEDEDEDEDVVVDEDEEEHNVNQSEPVDPMTADPVAGMNKQATQTFTITSQVDQFTGTCIMHLPVITDEELSRHSNSTHDVIIQQQAQQQQVALAIPSLTLFSTHQFHPIASWSLMILVAHHRYYSLFASILFILFACLTIIPNILNNLAVCIIVCICMSICACMELTRYDCSITKHLLQGFEPVIIIGYAMVHFTAAM